MEDAEYVQLAIQMIAFSHKFVSLSLMTRPIYSAETFGIS